jgi:hypothetical protein
MFLFLFLFFSSVRSLIFIISPVFFRPLVFIRGSRRGLPYPCYSAGYGGYPVPIMAQGKVAGAVFVQLL